MAIQWHLSTTSLFLIFPIIFFFKNLQMCNEFEFKFELILAFLLLINIIFSFLFWTNPVKNNLIHFYDGIFGKISYIFFPIYIIFIKDIKLMIKIIFIIILSLSSIMFYYSNKNSKLNWCCSKHLIYHSIFHISISIGCCIAFI
jgi:hypothetical protein